MIISYVIVKDWMTVMQNNKPLMQFSDLITAIFSHSLPAYVLKISGDKEQLQRQLSERGDFSAF